MAATLVDNELLCEYRERCIMKQYWGNFLALLRDAMKNLAHDSGCYGQVYNRPHPGHKSEVFPLQKVCLAEGLHSDVQNSKQQWSNWEMK